MRALCKLKHVSYSIQIYIFCYYLTVTTLIVPNELWAGLLLWIPQSLAHDPLAFGYVDPSHLWSNCAEHWTISDIGPKLPLCPSQDARWAHVRGYQEE